MRCHSNILIDDTEEILNFIQQDSLYIYISLRNTFIKNSEKNKFIIILNNPKL